MRLFTAVWPGPEAAAALEAALAVRPPWHPDGGWRPVPPERRHITLAFHGDDEPGPRARVLDAALAGRPAPRLRLAGVGTFRGVLWAGVETVDGALRDLAVGAGADPVAFRPHLTLARRSRGDDRRRPALADDPGPAPGPWWTPAEVLLVRSDTSRSDTVRGDTSRGDTVRGDTRRDGAGRSGPVYTVVHRVPLARDRT
ncbi:2'-5' RNA ligase family protein [Pseudonocardia nantongensis]|uniref:2'-5' RNA ligase family protein n=1 Tax=Pseudonocardia nantongensis TaxID=1181885 RepID=UPI00397D82CD